MDEGVSTRGAPAAPPPAPLDIALFGPFQARLDGSPLPRLRSRKGYWLLALLALRPGRESERSALAVTLWPDSTHTQTLANLRITLKDLRHVLGEEAVRLRSPSPHTLALDLAGAAVDVREFDRLSRSQSVLPPPRRESAPRVESPPIAGFAATTASDIHATRHPR